MQILTPLARYRENERAGSVDDGRGSEGECGGHRERLGRGWGEYRKRVPASTLLVSALSPASPPPSYTPSLPDRSPSQHARHLLVAAQVGLQRHHARLCTPTRAQSSRHHTETSTYTLPRFGPPHPSLATPQTSESVMSCSRTPLAHDRACTVQRAPPQRDQRSVYPPTQRRRLPLRPTRLPGRRARAAACLRPARVRGCWRFWVRSQAQG